uniref:Uncharacterized protein n=1 Tax=Trypanosoma congolense (strain IL3000) TaxID=1068625 RepID=G0UVN9_TRYCI|nr:conserved hypothetical protein [Trypanosoma congolense IL3000]
MELPVEALLESAPVRQKYLRAAHILFGGIGESLKPAVRRRILISTANLVQEGLCVQDFHHFREHCSRRKEWCSDIEPLLSAQGEFDVAERADAAVQAALSSLKTPRTSGGEGHNPGAGLSASGTLGMSRQEIAKECKLEERLSLAETFAAVHDYGSMKDVLKQLSFSVQCIQQATMCSYRLPLLLVQLEVIRRTVEMWLNAADLEAVRPLVGEPTSSLLAEITNLLVPEQEGDSSHFLSRQWTATNTFSELEDFVLFFSLAHALCLFERRDFEGFVRVFTAEGLRGGTWSPIAAEFIVKRSASQTASSFGGRISVSGSLPVVRHLRCIVEKNITSGAQLGVMILLCAIATWPRAAAMELVTRMDVMQLWEDVPEAHMLVQAVQKANFAEAIHAASILGFAYVKTDLFGHRHYEFLLQHFKEAIVLRYINCFTDVDLRKTAMHLSIPLREMVHIVRELISKDHIKGKIDFVSYVLKMVNDFSPTENLANETRILLDCLHRNVKCTENLEHSLRLLSLRKHGQM